MIVIDRSSTKSDKNTSNRQRFINRYKKYLKGKVNQVIERTNIADATGPVSVSVDWTLEDVKIEFDNATGSQDMVVSGNDQFHKNDRIIYDREMGDDGGDGLGEDNYRLQLTKEEFFDLYFSDMDLPNFVKESMVETSKPCLYRAGYSRSGPWNRLDILKTFMLSLARRVANKNAPKKLPFIDEIDLRYKNYVNRPKPMLKAVMFCCMDVSGSMESFQKFLSKKFFIFLYLFLTKNYQSIDIRFIRYHHKPKDCGEEEFFYSRETGGTEVLPALELINNIIDKEYDLNIYNIYIAHTSDGDTGFDDTDIKLVGFLDATLLPKVQYYAYVQILGSESRIKDFDEGRAGLLGVLQHSKYINTKLNTVAITDANEIYPVLHNLFNKNKGKKNG